MIKTIFGVLTVLVVLSFFGAVCYVTLIEGDFKIEIKTTEGDFTLYRTTNSPETYASHVLSYGFNYRGVRYMPSCVRSVKLTLINSTEKQRNFFKEFVNLKELIK